MDREQATKILTEAGREHEVVEILEGMHDRTSAAYKSIEDDPDLNDEAKQRRQATYYLGVMDEVNEKLSDLASRVTVVDHDDASTIFGVKDLDGDPASLAISRRDAGDRVDASDSVEDKRNLLDRALRSGDEVLARAVLEWAVQAGDKETVNRYLSARPEHQAGLERLWAAEHSPRRGSMRTAFALSGLRGGRLSGMTSYQIQALTEPAYR
ncbi:hypothetical protein [Aeromicrobium sp. Leaf245]|uniref:hypothetical protein n=1 Tax=Aeromicrobium sp. Leaf245 TaxID=1736306 RepID=UPI000AEE453E|nr:hypothetical protein [Aeromicrobium sp. Leaf245]